MGSQIYPGLCQTYMIEGQWDIGGKVGEGVKTLGRWVGRGETRSTAA